MHTARIHWIRPEHGGRTLPPSGPRYSTVARLADRSSNEEWSVVLYISSAADRQWVMDAKITMLSDAEAARFLVPGHKFELYEGDVRVATGEVVNPA